TPSPWPGSCQPESVPLLTRLLAPWGAICRWRAAMGLSLNSLTEEAKLPEGYEFLSWDPVWLHHLSEIDWRSYAGTIDSALYGRYFHTPEGSRRLWQEAISGRFGCFDPERTLLLMHDSEPHGHVMAC